MKTFSVKEIAELLNTNPETVRRWIRDGKIEATQSSKKEGNVVSEDALKKFLEATPKYARLLMPLGVTYPLAVGLPITLATLASYVLLGKKSLNKGNAVSISSKELTAEIERQISEYENSLERKEKNLEQLKAEIKEERKKISDLKYLLEEAKSLSVLEEGNIK